MLTTRFASFALLASLGATCSLIACGEDDPPPPSDLEPGAPCDPDGEAENGGCAEGTECAVPGASVTSTGETGAAGSASDAEPICLIGEGGDCDPEADDPYCAGNLTCAELASGGHKCFAPVVFEGTVTSTADASAIGGAHVLAIDEEGVAVTDIAVSESDGTYRLEVPVARNDDGTPVDADFTLRSAAQDYLPFPEGIRVALPISTSDASEGEDGLVVATALTDVGLVPLPAGDRQQVAGSLSQPDDATGKLGGVLVILTGDGGTFSAVADRDGEFTAFNVPDGTYTARAYAAGLSFDEGTVTVSGEAVDDLGLALNDTPTTTVSGNIQIVNAFGGAVTSVILVVEDTFDATAARGEVPRGFRAPVTGPVSIDGDFSIEGVPVGTYVALAAYENDRLVRDPDTNIAGTSFVTVEVTADSAPDLTIDESFKVTEALEIVSPGADGPEAVTEKPVLTWADDSSEDGYEVRVYDAFGELVWEDLTIDGVSGSDTVSVAYDGPLEDGMYYQFRVLSWRQPGGGSKSPISASEDLKGVFFKSMN